MKTNFKSIVKAYGFTLYGLAILGLIVLGTYLDIQYDDGIHGLIYHFIVIPVMGIMFFLPNELLFSLNDGRAIPNQYIYSILIGFILCLSVDFIRYELRKYYIKKQLFSKNNNKKVLNNQ